MDIIQIGKLIDPSEFSKYIEEAEKLEVFVHVYGQAFYIPEYPCWMEYKNEGDQIGSISFTRNTYKHPVLSLMTNELVELFTPIFPKDNPPLQERWHFIKTTGNIVTHRDEAGRNACINIGVKNSSGAITRLSNDGIFENFENNNSEYIIKEGFGYLLNTHQWHSVESTSTEPRYLITYGFGAKFDNLRKALRI